MVSACGTRARSNGHAATLLSGSSGSAWSSQSRAVSRGCGSPSLGAVGGAGEEDGLDQAVDADRVGGEGDHAVGGEQAELPRRPARRGPWPPSMVRGMLSGA